MYLHYVSHALLTSFCTGAIICVTIKVNEITTQTCVYKYVFFLFQGFCQVLKQLRGVTPSLNCNKKQTAEMDAKIPKLAGFVKGSSVKFACICSAI